MERDMHEGMWIWVFFRIIFAIIVASIVFGLIFNFAFQPLMNSNWLWNVFGILVFIWLVSWIARWPYRRRSWDWGYEDHEMRILRRRYARGEITEAQYKKMMKVLKQESNKD